MIEVDKKSTVERRVIILNKLEADGQVDVGALSEELKVSEVTIRNDLRRLEQKNMLIRARGGAIKLDRVGVDFALSDKNKKHLEEKKNIGFAAAQLVEEGDTIILDSGTTTLEIAKNLTNLTELTVITNALNVANQLAEHQNANVIVPGGFLRKNSLSLVGATAEESFRNYFCDKLFLAVDGFSTTHGLSTPNVEEAHLNRIMIDISKKVIVVTDSSKFLKRSFAFIAPISEVDVVVTDAGIPLEDQKKLENMGIQVIVV
ncbi:DeoR family transcriptional regulator [Adhaeribacter aerolatus]|uniref:DeoR family transcriptional regulator n=1 Tax=Adhaeribacter aerolatus TaxID=670289 RepID=A0A512B3D1_9BACT|nr:transcriptional repressor AgaR [Adhaeribacter aerolatus]GEO06473.1 DeoR family transcriptional regulator [Adhaeribacter aerolatus]